MFDDYYRSMSREDRQAFAGRAGTSTAYIEIHLLPRRKMPKKETMLALAKASNGGLAFEDLVNYFLLHDVA